MYGPRRWLRELRRDRKRTSTKSCHVSLAYKKIHTTLVMWVHLVSGGVVGRHSTLTFVGKEKKNRRRGGCTCGVEDSRRMTHPAGYFVSQLKVRSCCKNDSVTRKKLKLCFILSAATIREAYIRCKWYILRGILALLVSRESASAWFEIWEEKKIIIIFRKFKFAVTVICIEPLAQQSIC